MKASDIKMQITRGAAEIVRLHQRIHETVLERDKNPAAWADWKQACAEFHRRYSALAFPGGYMQALEKFRNDDPSVIEPALCFLELRPYFFRSGYMFSMLMRRVKRAPLSASQRERLDAVLARRDAWRARKGRHTT